jgi:Cu-processing system permease protein
VKKFWILLSFGLREQVRSRWVLAYGLFFFGVGVMLLQFGSDYRRYLASMTSVVMLLNPAVAVLYTTVYWYSNSSFRQLIMVQPVSRRVVFFSSWLSILIGLSVAFAAGTLAAPLVVGDFDARIFSLVAAGLLLTAVFSLLGVLWAVAVRDRMRGLSVALGTWLYLAVLHDGAVLGLLMIFRDYPMETPAFALLAMNPIDLARLFLLLNFDLTALMGYTGSLLEKMAQPGIGALLVGAGTVLWVGIPALITERIFRRRDF